MKKRQWRMLMTEILEARNDSSGYHAYLANRIEELRLKLQDIERRLPPEPDAIAVTAQSDPPPPDNIDYASLRWRTQNPDGTWRDCID